MKWDKNMVYNIPHYLTKRLLFGCIDMSFNTLFTRIGRKLSSKYVYRFSQKKKRKKSMYIEYIGSGHFISKGDEYHFDFFFFLEKNEEKRI
jgi:hypothetical protein